MAAKHELVANTHYAYSKIMDLAKAYGVAEMTVIRWLEAWKVVKIRMIVDEKEKRFYMAVDDFCEMKQEINFLARHIQYKKKWQRKRSI